MPPSPPSPDSVTADAMPDAAKRFPTLDHDPTLAPVPHAPGHRLDPYRDSSVTEARLRWITPVDLDVPRRAGERLTSRELARRPLSSTPTGRRVQLLVLAALFSWRCLTLQQLVALTGIAKLGDVRNQDLRHMAARGLIEVGAFAPGSERIDFSSPTLLLRCGQPAKVRPFLAQCRLLDEALVTGQRDWTYGSVFARHDVLAVEAALRLTEHFGDITGVLGPSFSTLNDLLGDGANLKSLKMRNKRRYSKSADATIFAATGHRIALEIQSHWGKNAYKKVRRWVLYLDKAEPANPVSVLFVHAPPQGHNFTQSLDAAIAKALSKSKRPDRIRGQLLITHWDRLFPEEDLRRPSTGELQRLALPLGHRARTATIEGHQLPGTDEALTSIEVVNGLLQTPHWLFTDRSHATVLDHLLDEPRSALSRLERPHRAHSRTTGSRDAA